MAVGAVWRMAGLREWCWEGGPVIPPTDGSGASTVLPLKTRLATREAKRLSPCSPRLLFWLEQQIINTLKKKKKQCREKAGFEGKDRLL